MCIRDRVGTSFFIRTKTNVGTQKIYIGPLNNASFVSLVANNDIVSGSYTLGLRPKAASTGWQWIVVAALIGGAIILAAIVGYRVFKKKQGDASLAQPIVDYKTATEAQGTQNICFFVLERVQRQSFIRSDES
eukprot:TRINITY_DN11860_c0_g1_i1.p1 TRINITY_DN11860_c0_g1~~TRINITY_DN11860_c0_g1_i1.p1  ORF type:complete len:156 (-),score=16.51 TRINITY_DN11860_c0_g1_i1:135-533(-)